MQLTQPRVLSFNFFAKRCLDSELIGVDLAARPLSFDQKRSFWSDEAIIDSVYFIGQDLPSSLIIGVVMYPSPVDDNNLLQIPLIHSSTSLHLSSNLALSTCAAMTPSFRSCAAFDAREDGDVTIILKDGILRAHSLAFRHGATGSYFAAILSQPMQEQQTRTIYLLDLECALFKEILRFIYTGRAFIDFSRPMARFALIDFYKAADRFQLTECASAARNALECSLRDPFAPRVACEVLKSIFAYPDLERCQVLCLRTLIHAGKEVEDSQEWTELEDTPGFAGCMRRVMGLPRKFIVKQ
ncbi:hypothetical protein HDV00_006432 [Rhizophlyctis rosea]|nr:hypothetical protein HDV00_006432 [Rhizophlyctis rosea]